MREILITIIVLLIIFSFATITKNYLNHTADDLIFNLDELKEKISIENNKEDIKQKAEEIMEKWSNANEIWALIVIHDELDLIEISLTGMKASIEVEKFEDTIQELEKAKFLIGHIKEKERFSLKNVF